ncbi:MAG: hypothetical protein WDM79_04250 [Terricaulis sp.]
MDADGRRLQGLQRPNIQSRGDILYHTDSSIRTVYQFDLAPDGSLSNKRDFVRSRKNGAIPTA